MYVPGNDNEEVFGWIASVADITKYRQIEAELGAEKERIAADLDAVSRLQELGNQCVRVGDDLERCLAHILETAIALTGAQKGTLAGASAGRSRAVALVTAVTRVGAK